MGKLTVKMPNYDAGIINPSGKLHDQVFVFTDGGCIHNPGGVGGCGVVVCGQGKEIILKMNARLESATNNTAEYMALTLGLRVSGFFTDNIVRAYTDSRLVFNQLTGRWRIKKKHLAICAHGVTECEKYFKVVHYNWTPRETRRIQIADELAGQAIRNELILLSEGKIK